MRGGHPADDNLGVAVVVDGVTVSSHRAASEWSDVRVAIPARPERRGLTLGLRSSATFVPGARDPRALGVMLDRLSLRPDGIVVVPRPALIRTAAASAAMGAGIALLGVTAGSAIVGAVLLSAGASAIVARGFGPFTDYPTTVSTLGLWIAIVLAAGGIAVQYRRPLRNTARFAAACSASALFLKLLVLLHPNMPIGDAMFHAHRFQGVLAGNLYFTSIAPGGYSFPYPPGLYVFASMFAGLVRRGASDMALLRTIATAADAAAGLLLYWIVMRAWGNRLAAAMAVAIYHLVPVGLGVLTTGNLTNAFAQALAVGALGLMGAGRGGAGTFAALALVLAASYLSHTSTLAIVFVATIATAALLLLRGGPSMRRVAAGVALATLTAAVLAVVLYYAHFMETYRAELSRIGHETAAASADAGGRTIGDRLRLVPYSIGVYIGAPVLLFAFLGAVELARRRETDRLALRSEAGRCRACCFSRSGS